MTPARVLKLAQAALDAGNLTTAEIHFRRVLEVNPHHEGARRALLLIEAQWLHKYALGQASYGHMDVAGAAWDHALKMGPEYFGFYLSLLRTQPEIYADHVLAMRRESVPAAMEHLYDWAMYRACEHKGWPDRAWTHLEHANQRMRAIQPYDEVATLMYLGRTVATFTPDMVAYYNDCSFPTDAPIFIVGLPRSGTTLVEQILASHPNVTGLGELRTLGQLAKDVEFPEGVVRRGFQGPGFYALAEEYLAQLPAFDMPTPRFTDKMPDNSRYVGLINICFRQAKIVHVRRNLADTAMSYYAELFFEGHPWSYGLEELGRYIVAHERMMAWWKKIGIPMVEVSYEALVQNPKVEMERLLGALHLEWSDHCSDFHHTQRPVLTASIAQVRKPIYQTAIGRWQAYQEGLKPLLTILEAGGCNFR